MAQHVSCVKEYVIQEVSPGKGEAAFVLKPSVVMIEATCSLTAPNQCGADSYLVPFNHCYSSFMLLEICSFSSTCTAGILCASSGDPGILSNALALPYSGGYFST